MSSESHPELAARVTAGPLGDEEILEIYELSRGDAGRYGFDRYIDVGNMPPVTTTDTEETEGSQFSANEALARHGRIRDEIRGKREERETQSSTVSEADARALITTLSDENLRIA